MEGRVLCLIVWTFAVAVAEQSSDVLLSAMEDRQQYLNYPVNSSAYPSYANRGWLFATSPGYVVHVTFTYIDVEDSPAGCTYDFLEVFDSSQPTNKVDRLCGYQTKRQFFSSGPNLYITFRSDGGVTRTGFKLTYQAVASSTVYPPAACTSSFLLTSELHDNRFLKYPATRTSYPNNTDCGWLIQTYNDSYIVHLTFLSVDIEVTAMGCDFDFVEILDDSYTYTKSLGKICGNQTRGEFYSSGRSLLVKFHSDYSITARGFHLSYESVPLSEIPRETAFVPTVRVRASSLQQYLEYPANGSTYPNNSDCSWLFQTDCLQYVVNITFTYVDVESSIFGCTYDNIEVYDGASETNKLDRLCGTREKLQYYSSSTSMYVTFHSDREIARRGFRLSYQAVPQTSFLQSTVCPTAVRLTAYFHRLQYLKYPADTSDYSNNLDCGWTLQADVQNTVVHVNFTIVDTESIRDFVELFDGPNSYATSLGNLSGHLTHHEVYSSGPSLFVKFHSDYSVTGKGFQLSYEAVFRSEIPAHFNAVCTSQVQTQAVSFSTQTLQYPVFSINYPSNADCAWLLQTDSDDQVVHVTFTYVDTESSSSCSYDYVELLDGSSSYSSTIAKVCGQTTGDFYSTGRSMYIKFHSDGSTERRGFQLTYQAVYNWNVPTNGVCTSQVMTRTVSFDTNTLKYPASSIPYPPNADCAWLLQTNSYDQVVHVTFTYLDTESSSSCSYDYVELLDGSSSYSSRIAKVCGQTTGDFYSTGQYMYIKFHSDGSSQGRGFQLTYQAVYSWNVPTTYAPADFDFEYNSGLSSGAIAGVALVSSLFFIGIVTIIIVIVKRQRLQQPTATVPTIAANNQFPTYSYPPPSAPTVRPPAVSASAPPAYNVLFPSWGAGYPVNGAHPVSTPLQQSVPPGVYPAVVHPPAASSTGAGAQAPDSVDQISGAQVTEGQVNLSFSMELTGPVYYNTSSDRL